MRDFKRMQTDPPEGVNGAPLDNDIMKWHAVIFGCVPGMHAPRAAAAASHQREMGTAQRVQELCRHAARRSPHTSTTRRHRMATAAPARTR